MFDKIYIINDKRERVEATAPVIISASRSTDIPAFYAKWFFNRLAKGYCAWYNPFNLQKCISLSVNVRSLFFGQRIPNQLFLIFIYWMKWVFIITFK